MTGELDLRELGAEEGVVFNAEIAAAIQEKLAGSNYGTLLAERGVTTVALDRSGEIIEHRPDGSSVPLARKISRGMLDGKLLGRITNVRDAQPHRTAGGWACGSA